MEKIIVGKKWKRGKSLFANIQIINIHYCLADNNHVAVYPVKGMPHSGAKHP